MHVVLEEAPGEQPQHALQVGHRHVAIDQQALDLVEHRVVRGVGRVGPIDAAQRNDPHRRRRLFHHADLHRAGLAAQQQAILRGRWRLASGRLARALRSTAPWPGRSYPAGRGPDAPPGCSGPRNCATRLRPPGRRPR